MRTRSKKRGSQEREYSILRRKFLLDHPNCKVRMPGCSLRASQVHHSKGRIGDLLTDISKWVPLCPSCHEFLERNPIIAKELNFSKNRL